MKKTILITALLGLLAVSKSNAQGFFNFANGASGVNAPVTQADGTTKLDSSYLATYYYGAAGISDDSALTASGVSQAFSSGVNAGYFFGGQQVISGQTGTVTLQVRAWKASDGATWAIASGKGGASVGKGNLIQLALGTGSNPTPNMVGLQAFSLAAPEPATIALGLMGASALFIRRRK